MSCRRAIRWSKLPGPRATLRTCPWPPRRHQATPSGGAPPGLGPPVGGGPAEASCRVLPYRAESSSLPTLVTNPSASTALPPSPPPFGKRPVLLRFLDVRRATPAPGLMNLTAGGGPLDASAAAGAVDDDEAVPGPSCTVGAFAQGSGTAAVGGALTSGRPDAGIPAPSRVVGAGPSSAVSPSPTALKSDPHHPRNEPAMPTAGLLRVASRARKPLASAPAHRPAAPAPRPSRLDPPALPHAEQDGSSSGTQVPGPAVQARARAVRSPVRCCE